VSNIRLCILCILALGGCQAKIDNYDEAFLVTVGQQREAAIQEIIQKGHDTSKIKKEDTMPDNIYKGIRSYQTWTIPDSNFLDTPVEYTITFYNEKNIVQEVWVTFKNKDMDAFARAKAMVKKRFSNATDIEEASGADSVVRIMGSDPHQEVVLSYYSAKYPFVPVIYSQWSGTSESLLDK